MEIFYKCDDWSFADAQRFDLDVWCDLNAEGRQAWMTPAVRADIRRRLEQTGAYVAHGFILAVNMQALRHATTR